MDTRAPHRSGFCSIRGGTIHASGRPQTTAVVSTMRLLPVHSPPISLQSWRLLAVRTALAMRLSRLRIRFRLDDASLRSCGRGLGGACIEARRPPRRPLARRTAADPAPLALLLEVLVRRPERGSAAARGVASPGARVATHAATAPSVDPTPAAPSRTSPVRGAPVAAGSAPASSAPRVEGGKPRTWQVTTAA